MQIEQLFSIEQVAQKDWRTLEPPDFPFFDFEFLRALERSGSVGSGSGWMPAYLVCRDETGLLGAFCTYLKTDSYGEYIFDWEWAHAYREYGLSYYPKLVCAVPFTPATGPKLLVRTGLEEARATEVRSVLLDAARELGDEYDVSSSHALFVPERELDEFAGRGFAIRHSMQFHWRNRDYGEFADYLGEMESKRRRQVARERRQLEGEALTIERLSGETLEPGYAGLMYRFYLRTLDGKWGVPYLNGSFFEEVFQTMGDRILFVLARDEAGRSIAGALNFFKGPSIFGRYWGATEERRNLHFELCYYQAIEFAIERGLKLFEAGAQGEHKLARGFLPSLTYSAHDIRHPAFRHAIGRYIDEERDMMDLTLAEYSKHNPYKQ